MVKPERVRVLKHSANESSGPVVYWMSREQRVRDNWALLRAQELAMEKATHVEVVFALRKKMPNTAVCVLEFMLSGLSQVAEDLGELNIPFTLLLGHPEKEIVKFVRDRKASVLVTDFSPLKYNREWKEFVEKYVSCGFEEVDARNIIPVWQASPKQEFGAYTLRPKIAKLLPEYLEIPGYVQKQSGRFSFEKFSARGVLKDISCDRDIVLKNVSKKSGENAALHKLKSFVNEKLVSYDSDRNDPNKDAQSGLSPYLHFGQLYAGRVALEVLHASKLDPQDLFSKNAKWNNLQKSAAAFLEELIVRRELSDNFCFYNEHYDSPEGYPEWAKKTLKHHEKDKRELVYSLAEFEHAKTHDPLWNAAQNEMKQTGKMHGYMRMYWAKKILEWTPNIAKAQKLAIYLNDKYELDGRDPNGYTGIAWSLGGVHDRAWFERPIFGQIRYMNFNGAKTKFDVQKYIEKWS